MTTHDPTLPGAPLDPCAEVRIRISAAHDGEATLDPSALLHLTRCSGCSAFREGLPRLGLLFEQHLELRPPQALRERVLRAPGAPLTRSGLALWIPRAAASLVGFLSMAGLLLLEHDGGGEHEAISDRALEQLHRIGEGLHLRVGSHRDLEQAVWSQITALTEEGR